MPSFRLSILQDVHDKKTPANEKNKEEGKRFSAKVLASRKYK